MKKLLASVAAGALLALGGADPAHADNIVFNQWYTGHFGSSANTPLLSGILYTAGTYGPILPNGTVANAIAAPGAAGSDLSVTITLSAGSSGYLTVTDVEGTGDQFQMLDNGAAMTLAASTLNPAGQTGLTGGLTSSPDDNADYCGKDISCALSESDVSAGMAYFSSGTFLLDPGENVITGELVATGIGDGDMDFIAEETAAVPEPASLVLFGTGLLGLGLFRRRRQRPPPS